MPASRLDHHLATCPYCARWVAEATRLSRLARVGREDTPDLADRILAEVALPAARVRRRRRLAQLGLAAVGLVQIAIAVPALFGTTIDMAMVTHAAHESAAWNVALGAAFLATAFAPRRAAGLLPLLVAFVGVLVVLSARDLASGAVELGRLATHLGAVAGLVLVYALYVSERATPPPASATVGTDQPDEPGRGLRGVA
jgi:predicted anti-sigma-YlaC factor YlaD